MCVVENNVPYISSPAAQQWLVLQENSVNISISDADNDTVHLFPLTPLPRGSSLVQLPALNTWQFVWTPVNMDPVKLVYVKRNSYSLQLTEQPTNEILK